MRGRKTGGRDFKKGEGGRPKGAKNKVPGSVKAEINDVLKKMGVDQERAKEILRRVCQSKGARDGCPYLPFAAFFLGWQYRQTDVGTFTRPKN